MLNLLVQRVLIFLKFRKGAIGETPYENFKKFSTSERKNQGYIW